MSRSKWKGYIVSSILFNREFKKKKLIWSKNSTITGELKNQTVFVYNGKEFKKLFITPGKIGFKFGQFIATRTFTQKFNLKNKKKIINIWAKKQIF